jgi:hypothetical protein
MAAQEGCCRALEREPPNRNKLADFIRAHHPSRLKRLEQALRVLGRAAERKDQTVAWLRACQLPCGGFTYQPKAQIGAVDDVAYTWAAAFCWRRGAEAGAMVRVGAPRAAAPARCSRREGADGDAERSLHAHGDRL